MEEYKDASLPVGERVADLLARMTPAEKVAQLCSAWGYDVMERRERFAPEKAEAVLGKGIGQITRHGNATQLEPGRVAEFANRVQRFLAEKTRLGIPAILHEECLCGYQARGATIFPQSIGIASTWDPEIVERMCAAIGGQLEAVGAHQGLAPVLDVARDPRWGRTEETYGEDPYLVARIGVAYIRGLQSRGILATTKHFAGYSFCEGGLNWAPAHIGPREYREVCLFPFEAAVREAGAGSVMNAYNEIDGIPCGASRRLLTDILRGEWGFDGFVVSDYESVKELCNYHNVCADPPSAAKLALEAGIDVELPETQCYGSLVELVESGLLSERTVDEAVKRVLRRKFELGLFENPYVDVEVVDARFDGPADRRLARETARKSIVLLKNAGALLPLPKGIGRIAVIGPNADSWRNLLGDYSYPAILELRKIAHQTMDKELMIGADFDIRAVNVPVVTVLQGVKAKVSGSTEVLYAKGCDVLGASREGFAEARRAAAAADAAVVVVGGKSGYTPDCTSGEERDRADLGLPGVQEVLVEAVAATGTPLVVVLVNGRPYSIPRTVEIAGAVVEAWLPGEEGGNAVADVLFGDYNPGGKLPITFPRSVGQVPIYAAHKPSARKSHLWGEYVDGKTTALFPFGHGLSYTTFEYSGLTVTPAEVPTSGCVAIALDLANSGERAGEEVVQLYVRDAVASVTRPVKELKGFKRVRLEPGRRARITFELSTDLLSFLDRDMELVVEPGEFRVMIGSSAEDIRLTGGLTVTGGKRRIAGRRHYFSMVRCEGPTSADMQRRGKR